MKVAIFGDFSKVHTFEKSLKMIIFCDFSKVRLAFEKSLKIIIFSDH